MGVPRFQYFIESAPAKGAISATFRVWDTDCNGKLSRLELSTVLRKAMPSITESHLNSIFEELDADKCLGVFEEIEGVKLWIPFDSLIFNR